MDDGVRRGPRGGGDTAPTTAGRILALDTLTLLPVALLGLYADPPYLLDAALMLAFLGTVAAARYHGEKRIS